LYRHFDGELYTIHGFAQHTKTGEWMVIYSDCMSLHRWVYPYEEFMEDVNINGRSVPRFELVAFQNVSEE
jgi:hypothetical protein